MTQELVVSIGNAENLAKIVDAKALSWDTFASKLAAQPPVSEDKASEGWYCPVKFEPAYRDSENFVARYALTFDYDDIDKADVAKIEVAYRDYAYVMYTTASHTKDKPRIRMVFPLTRPAAIDEFCAVTRKHGALFDLEKLARESDTPAQMMFLPTKRPDGIFRSKINDGKWVDVDAVLASYADWHDRSAWPHRLRADSVGAVEATRPDTKLGVVGDFCRAFRVPEAIAKFALPYVQGSSSDRYTFTDGSRPDGLRIYDDGLKGHSDHNTDPANGQNNAFDLVRLHRFGELDTEADLALPITERPSYKAMCKFAMEQPEVRAAQLANEFVDLGPEPAGTGEAASAAAGNETVDAAQPIVLARPLVDVLRTPTIPRWLLRDRLEHGVIALMAGPRGSYKSFIATDWSMEVAVAGHDVYVVSAEGADYDRRARAWLMDKGDGRKPEDLGVFVAEKRIDLNTHENIELIRQDCLRLGIRPRLFVLDTFSKLSGGLDENSNTEVKAFIGRLDNGLKRAFDATVLLIAHTGHTDKGRARGASALEADTDAAYIVNRNDNLKIVGVSRQRFKASAELEPLWLSPEIINLGYVDGDGQPVSSLVLRPAEAPTMMGKGDGLSERQRAVLHDVQALLAGRSSGEILSDELVAALAEGMVKPEGRDTRGQQAKRTIQTLIDRKHLHLRNGRVSVTRAEFTNEEDWKE